MTSAAPVFGPNAVYVNTLGGTQLKSGPGVILGPFVVTSTGSVDSIISLYDGTSTAGLPIATQSMFGVGQRMCPNYSFANGLFVNVTGTTPGVAQIVFD